MSFELRTFSRTELRAAPDFVLEGTALTYDQCSPDDQLMPGVREKIAPGCFSDSIRNGGYQGDCICTVNHKDDRVCGRLSNGTLQLFDSPKNLRFRCQLDKNNPDHKAIHASVARGDMHQCSFSFIVDEDDFQPDTDSKGQPCVTRVVKRGQLLDVSAVTRPFYSLPGSTSVSARAAEIRSAREAILKAAARENAAPDLKEAIAKLRKAARLMGSTLLRDATATDEMALVGYASADDQMALVRGHLAVAHSLAEAAQAMCGTARSIVDSWDWDTGGDCDDDDCDDSRAKKAQETLRSFREAFTRAYQSTDMACADIAIARIHRRLGKPYVPKSKK